MRRQSTTTIVTYSLLFLAGGVAIVLPDDLGVGQASAYAPPQTIRLPGTVRDFRNTDADFLTPPSGGNGHYAGNISYDLSDESTPVFLGGGFRVSTQWRQKANEPIAPHLYRNANEMRKVRLVNGPVINNNPTIDTFNSTAGPYSLANQGPAPTFVAGATMPTVTAPTGMPALVNEYLRDGAGTTVVNSDIHCNKFLIRNHHRLQFSGARRVLCNQELMIENFAKIELLPGATLDIWFKDVATIKNNIDFNLTTSDPSRLRVYNLGTNLFTIENSAATYMNYVAPGGGLHVKNSGQFCGSYTGKTLQIDNGCGYHHDTGGPTHMCGAEYADTAGTAGSASSGGIVSASSFDRWYTNVPAVNLAGVHAIELTRNNAGVYEYHNDEFFPIDDLLFGNQGQSHNYYFTYTIQTRFTYDSCVGQFFEFQGADDAWAFVNGELAMDLGGIMPGTKQYVEMDRLGLTDGESYTLHFFYAQRNNSVAGFHMRTNLELEGQDMPSMTASVD